MKHFVALSLTLLASSLVAQTPLPPACGPDATVFHVKTVPTTPIAEPQPGTATLVFIQDQVEVRPGQSACPFCTTQLGFGMDGQWVAATRGFSHFSLSVAPGEHHFCASNSREIQSAPLPAFYALTLEAGHTYYLRARPVYPYKGFTGLELNQPNPDEARYLISVSKQSTFTMKSQ